MSSPSALVEPSGWIADRSRTSPRIDWLLTLLSIWLIGGFYVDLWAHAHGQVDDTFFTPWHAVLYSGAASFGIVLGLLAILGQPRGVPLRETLPGPYRMAFVGAALFVAGGVLDLAWHELFGFEVDVEALFSPTHLLLAASGLLMVGGPIRSAAARLAGAPRAPSWRDAGPFVIPLAMGAAVLIAFTQYANPIVDVWSAALESENADPVAQIYSMDAVGEGQTRLAVTDGDARSPRLSPDGFMVAYAVTDGDSDQIHVIRNRTADAAVTSEGSNFRPAWSPDGSRIAFSSIRGQAEPDIWVMAPDGAQQQQLTDDPASDWAPTWSPDGGSIAFNSDRAGTFDLVRIDADGANATPLTSGPADDYEPDWAPDGTQIAFTSNRDGDWRIWLVAAGGGEPTRLETGEGTAYMPSWSPDGSMIAFSSDRTGDFEVFVVPSGGGEPRNVSRNPGADDGWVSPAWARDGSILYPSEGFRPFWTEPYVRQGFGAAAILVLATILSGVLAFARRRAPLPFGAWTVLVAVPSAMATVLSDQFQFIPGLVVAGVAADVAARIWPAGRSRLGDALVACIVPIVFFAGYFATVAVTSGIGWSIHLWFGAIATAGAIGLFVDELARWPSRRVGEDAT